MVMGLGTASPDATGNDSPLFPWPKPFRGDSKTRPAATETAQTHLFLGVGPGTKEQESGIPIKSQAQHTASLALALWARQACPIRSGFRFPILDFYFLIHHFNGEDDHGRRPQ
jgi:hypothetical protein